MLFLMHPFFFVFDEVEISLNRHLAPVKNQETGSETQKVYAIFVITGVHIVGIRRDIFDHKLCQQVVLITLSIPQIIFSVNSVLTQKRKNFIQTYRGLDFRL